MNKELKRIIILLSLFCLAFVVLIGYLTYFQIVRADKVKQNSYNKRLWINEDAVLRGKFLDRNGQVLVHSERGENGQSRIYNYGSLYSHVIGYSYRQYGKTGLELGYNNSLLNISESMAINDIKNLVLQNDVGNDIRLTIDHNSQVKARKLMDGKKGSLIAMNPKTGEIYTMISLPDFDVSNLNEHWRSITEDGDSPLLNRATQGLYVPGSVFKILTAVAGVEEGDREDFNCTGSFKIDGYEFNDYNKKPHGSLDRKYAFAKSCNTYFVNQSQVIKEENFVNLVERFMMNRVIDFDLAVNKSLYPTTGQSKTEYAASLIGQGKVQITPINMLLISSTIANNGNMMEPYLVSEVINKNNAVISTRRPKVLKNPIDSIVAEEVKDMMREVVVSGTGGNAKIKNLSVAGKTGTAENPSGKSHSWFTGFAPVEDPKVAIVVLLEEDGTTGGKTAAPIARDIIIEILKNIE